LIHESDFRPATWLPGPHLQTLWASILRPCPRPNFRRQRLHLPDDDFLDLDWLAEPGSGPTVMVVHGLEGSSDSSYARGLMDQVCRCGWGGVVMHFRSCSGEPNRQARSYCAGEIEDLEFSAEHVRQICGGPLFVVGYSLGGNALLSWLATPASTACIDAAVAVSVPFLLREAATRLKRGFSQAYQWKLLRDLKRSYQRKFQNRNDAPIPIENLSEIRDFFGYDDVITAPLHGYQGAEDYYRRASSRYSLAQIKLPTLILHARDDPFMTEAVIPDPEELAPNVRFELSRFGGHVGFVSGPPWRPRYWLEERISRFIEEQLGRHETDAQS